MIYNKFYYIILRFLKFFEIENVKEFLFVEKKSRVKRFSKIYYRKGSKTKSPASLIVIYSIVFVLIAAFSYLFSMGLNSYFKRPHCTKIELLPEEVEDGTEKGGLVVEKNGDGSADGSNFDENGGSNKKGVLNGEAEQKDFANGRVNGVEVDLRILESSSAFEKFLKKAKDDGKNAVIVHLKGDDGKLVFDSELKLAQEWKTVFARKGINFEEVAEKIASEGLIPVGRMSAFFDQTAPSVENENTYIFENSGGGKARVNVFSGGEGFKRGKWLDATKSSVRAYVVGLAAEITKLGFKHVLIDNAWFPLFKTTYETENFENEFCGEKERLKALSKFIDDLQASGVKAIFSYPGRVLYDSDLAVSLFGNLNLLKKVKLHAPIFLNEAEIKKCEQVLIELATSLVFIPELYSNSRNINNLLKKFSSYEIDSNLVVRNN